MRPVSDYFSYVLPILFLITKTIAILSAITMKRIYLRKRGFFLGSRLQFSMKFALSAGVVH